MGDPEKETRTYFLKIKGIVQGVGFRPTVYRTAKDLSLKGKVRNSSAGVEIFINATPGQIGNFLSTLKENKPPPSKINSIEKEILAEAKSFNDFQIVSSDENREQITLISPDLATCDQCIQELFDPDDRRYYYPFINCTYCGPRYSIIQEIPYDRPMTTMSEFDMCEKCQQEYENTFDRRFHAQPNACGDCGPQYFMKDSSNYEAIERAISMLIKGKIVAIKGISGFHIVCDAFNESAISRLREIKERPQKPFALMMPDIKKVSYHCDLSKKEKNWLQSPEAPILLLQTSDESDFPEELAPGLDTIGIMLPYTPIHHIILREGNFEALVMTSGNRSGYPLAKSGDEIREQLGDSVDAILDNNRLIHNRTDDSVGFIQGEEINLTRRARGFTPRPFELPVKKDPILGFGADLKGGFTLTRDNLAFKSQYISSLENQGSISFYQETLEQFLDWLKVQPVYGVIDAHPQYYSSKFAEDFDLKNIARVQHHYAHILSVMLEASLPNEPVIGVSFDGTGYGEDGAVWGSEFLVADYNDFKRVGHLQYYQLLGGDNAAIFPHYPAISLLYNAFGEDLSQLNLPLFDNIGASELENFIKPLSNNSFLNTSSMGRLFDGVAAIINLVDKNSYEGEAPMKLESLAQRKIKDTYNYNIQEDHDLLIDTTPLIKEIVSDFQAGIAPEVIASKFHNSIVDFSISVVEKIASNYNISTVLLSGGVWQNRYLLQKMKGNLRERGFKVITHHLIPPNDEDISFGQVAWGIYNFE